MTTLTSVPPGGHTFSFVGLIKAQMLQLFRQWGHLSAMLGSALLVAGIAALGGWAVARDLRSEHPVTSVSDLAGVPSFGFPFAVLLLGSVLGTLATTEWSSGSIIGTVATTQRRGAVVLAKVVGAVVGAATSMILAVGLSWGACALIFAATGSSIHVPVREALLNGVGVVVAGTLCALLALGIALIARKTALAMVVYIALVLVLTIVMALIPLESVRDLSVYLPLNACNSIMSASPPPEGMLSRAEGYLTMACWSAVALLVGWWRTVKTDI